MSSKILDDMRDVMRRRHYSIRTERSYCGWVKRFVLHFNMKSRDDLSEGEKKIETYLTFLARDRNMGRVEGRLSGLLSTLPLDVHFDFCNIILRSEAYAFKRIPRF